MLDVTIRVSQKPRKYNVGPWERLTRLNAVPRIGETVYVGDYSWGDHIGREGAEVVGVCNGLDDGVIIVDVEPIKDRGELHTVDGRTWLEKGSICYADKEDAVAEERVVLVGFSKVTD